jgi:hypothetical protein
VIDELSEFRRHFDGAGIPFEGPEATTMGLCYGQRITDDCMLIYHFDDDGRYVALDIETSKSITNVWVMNDFFSIDVHSQSDGESVMETRRWKPIPAPLQCPFCHGYVRGHQWIGSDSCSIVEIFSESLLMVSVTICEHGQDVDDCGICQ